MERPYDRLAKDTLKQVLLTASQTLVCEHEVAAEAQRLDLWCVPDPKKLDALAPFGLLRRIAEQGPIAFEFFHEAPSLDDILRSLRKVLFLRTVGLRLRLVVTSELPGTPDTLLLRAFGAERGLRGDAPSPR